MEEDLTEIKIISTRKIYELLELLRKKPHYFLSSNSITALQDFLNGYMLLGFSDDIYNPGEPDFGEFKYWILNKVKDIKELKGIGNPFPQVLLKECNGDEEKAFEKFFDYLEEYKKIVC